MRLSSACPPCLLAISSCPRGPGSQTVEKNEYTGDLHDTRWQKVGKESRFLRSEKGSLDFRVRNAATGETYSLAAGKEDGIADEFGCEDRWILNPSDAEISDGRNSFVDNVDADIDRYVDSSEDLSGQGVVVWYASTSTMTS